MTKDEALKLALEALIYASYEDSDYGEVLNAKVCSARVAIKKVLAQPEQVWMGLQFDDLPSEHLGDVLFLNGARWAEATLKERNA